MSGEDKYRLFLNGDEDAFDGIMREYFDGLIFFINRFVNDPHTAEDIAIDVFAYIAENRRKYNFKVSLKTYIYMIGKSRTLNLIKHRKRHAAEELHEYISAEDLSPENAFLKSEQARILNAALLNLPPDMRAAVHLVYFEGLSYKETAEILKKSAKQVDNLLCRAKAAMRKELEKEDIL